MSNYRNSFANLLADILLLFLELFQNQHNIYRHNINRRTEIVSYRNSFTNLIADLLGLLLALGVTVAAAGLSLSLTLPVVRTYNTIVV